MPRSDGFALRPARLILLRMMIDLLAKVSVFCFLASYAVAFGLEWTRLMRRPGISRLLVLALGLAGFVAHTAYLLVRSRNLESHLPPLLSSTHDWFLVLAWVVVLLYLFLTTLDRELAVGLFLLPVVPHDDAPDQSRFHCKAGCKGRTGRMAHPRD